MQHEIKEPESVNECLKEIKRLRAIIEYQETVIERARGRITELERETTRVY